MASYSEPHHKVFQEFGKDQNPKIKLFHGSILFQGGKASLLRNSTEITWLHYNCKKKKYLRKKMKDFQSSLIKKWKASM